MHGSLSHRRRIRITARAVAEHFEGRTLGGRLGVPVGSAAPPESEQQLEDTAAVPAGLLFPGDRTGHMSVRYLMDRFRLAREAAGRPDLTIHHLRDTALTIAGQHGATAAGFQARAGGMRRRAAMAIYQHATLDRDKSLAQKIGTTYEAWQASRP